MVEDREEHSLKSILFSASLFGFGYNLKNNYLKKYNMSTKKAAVVGAAFAVLPAFFSDEQDGPSNIVIAGVMAGLAVKGGNIKKFAINNMDLFENTLVNLKKLNQRQIQIKEFTLETRQKLFKERSENQGFIEGVYELTKEIFNHYKNGTKISKSKAFDIYNQLDKSSEELTLEEFTRLGKKIPHDLSDYVASRRKLDRQIANLDVGSNMLTTLGYFSDVKDGRLKLNPNKFLNEHTNFIKSKIDVLDTLPRYIFDNSIDLNKKLDLLGDELNKKGMDFFLDALSDGFKTNNNQVTYKQFMAKYGKELFISMGGKANTYFDSEGNAKYLDILGDQVFSDNLGMSRKGKIWDTTWLKPANWALDAVKGLESSIRPFFKSLPFGDNKQFPLLDTFNIDTKIYNSIYGNPISKLYVEKNDNIDLLKTRDILEQQINRMYNISDDKWRKRNHYKSISQAMFKSNELDNVYNPKIQTQEQLRKAIQLLEYKKTTIDDQIQKTGGTLKRSSLVGYDNQMDKAYNKYFVHVDGSRMTLMQHTENKVNSVFYNNKMYLKQNGKFTKQVGEYVFDTTKQTRIIQAKRSGEYYTDRANRVGRYIESENKPTQFDFFDFKDIYQNRSPKEALDYLKKSDLNLIPFLGRNGYKDSDNVLEDAVEPIERIRNYLKTTDKKDRETSAILSLLLGYEKQNKNFYKKYNEEVNNVFNSMMIKYKTGMQELEELINNNSLALRKYEVLTGNKKVVMPEVYLSALGINKLEKITKGMELSDNVIDAFKIQRAFEISSDKYNLVKDYKNVLQIGTGADNAVKRKLGKLYNPDNFKEDIIINTFNQGNSYDEFKNSFGDLLENNIMFHKETLFNKNRITNINSRTPNIVRRAFSDLDFSNGKNFIESTISSLSGDNKMGTNVGMFVTKGLESFENTLSTIGIPKLNSDNMSSTIEYFANIYTKRILPFYVGASLYGMLNSGIDAALPDSTPIFGEGLTAAAFKGIAAVRMGIQIAINGIGLGWVFRKIEEMFPGMLTDNGLLSPLQLSYTNEDMYATLYEGKEVEDRKNRFWYSSGRQLFSGGEIQNIRPSLLYLGQHRTAGIYENKVQRFFRQDFLPTKLAWTLVDPYMEERINAETRPVAKSADLFNSELPIFGGFINMFGKIIKPTKYFREDEWKISEGVMKNPEYDGQENTSPVLYYDTTWKSTEAVSKAFEDFKSIIGMRGYLLGEMSDMLFGGNEVKNQVELETLNTGQSMLDRYEQLNLGGMFGTTEPIRRILGNRAIDKTVSPLRNNSLPDWMPKNYFKNVSFGNIYNEMPFGEFVLPGEVYEKYNKLHPDDTGQYGVADRLKILSKVAPYSKEFRHTRKQALNRLSNMSSEERQIVYQSLSYADEWRRRDIERDERQEMATSDLSVTVKRVESPFEFYGTDNRRYKLSGVGLDFFDGKNSDEITAQMTEFQNMLTRGATFDGVVAQDPLTAVKTDNAGEYVEIYIPDFDQFDSLRQESYLRYSVESDGDITDFLMHGIKNSKKSASLEKIWGSKDTYYRYYYENILDPAFKNWETPVESFLSPILDTASASTRGYISSMNTAFRLGEYGDPVMPLLTTSAYLKGLVLGPNSVNRIERDNYLKDLNEYAKSQLPEDNYRGNFNSSIYNMTEYDGLSKMKNYLTDTERKYLDDIANEIDPEKREKLYDVSSDRMKMVLNTLWKRQAEYGGGKYEGEYLEMPDYEDEDVAEYNATNDTSYSNALFKYEMGFDLSSYEEQMLSMYGTEHLKEYKQKRNIAEYIDKMMGRENKQRVLSTTMGEDMMFFGY